MEHQPRENTKMEHQTMDYENELNHRLHHRWSPSAPLKPLFEARPVGTKYTWFHSADQPIRSNVPLYTYKDAAFNPGRGPVEGFMKSVDTESKLRSQFMALQKSDQAAYVPSFTSDLYQFPGAKPPANETLIEIPSRKPPPGLETMDFGNMTRLNLKK